MKNATTKSGKMRRIQIEISKESIRETFLKAIQEVESLKGFYKTYNASWKKDKGVFEKNNIIGLTLNDIIEKLVNSKTPKIDYEEIKELPINGKKFRDIIELQINQEDHQTNISYSMKPSFSHQNPKKTRSQMNEYSRQREIFIRSILSNIVIIFERYLAQVYEFIVVLNPESYFEGKTVKIKDLFSESIQRIIISEVRKQVSDNMYDSLKTLETMKEKSNFDINRFVPIQEEFKEIYYRRNVFVHNYGKANDIYLNSIAAKYKTNVKCNEPLVCDDIYIESSLDVLKKVICVLFYELLQVTNSDSSSYDVLSENVAFTALSDGEYSVAEYIYGLLRKRREFDFADKTMFEVNYMIALKQQNKSIQNLLESFDVSAMQDQFVIAKACLLGNDDEIYSILSKKYPDCMPAEAIRDWPLFLDFRKSEQYKKFKEEHAEDFKQYTFEAAEDDEILQNAEEICDEEGNTCT